MSNNIWKLFEYVGISKIYKGVHIYKFNNEGRIYMKYRGNALRKSAYFDTERDAALFVDSVLINAGKEPVNIYKRK